MELSQLHTHSLGLVSLIKQLNVKEIKVIPIELRMAAQEEVVASDFEQTSSFSTHEGEDNIKLTANNSITATWINLNSNRVTAPDVRRGDLVMIYRLGTTERYFWSDYNSKNVKRLETVTWAFSADAKKPVADDLSNAYFLELSTHNKTITFHTSQANGEPYGYDIQLNTADGIFRVIDTAGNTTWLDSANCCIGALNAEGTWLHLDKKNINCNAPDSMTVTAKNKINIKCTDFKLAASKSITLDTQTCALSASKSITFKTKDYQLTADSSITINSQTFTATATSNTFDCPSSVFTGSITAAGLSVAPGAGGAGSCDIQGPMTAQTATIANLTTPMLTAATATIGTLTCTAGTFQALTHGGAPCC